MANQYLPNFHRDPMLMSGDELTASIQKFKDQGNEGAHLFLQGVAAVRADRPDLLDMDEETFDYMHEVATADPAADAFLQGVLFARVSIRAAGGAK